MGRTFEQWWSTIPKDLRDKVRKGDEGNKPLLNQINHVWVTNLMAKKPELNPSAAELLDWVTSGQIDAIRQTKK
jgi:hypothetical protein